MADSYIDAVRSFRQGKQQAAVLEVPRKNAAVSPRKNPLNVRSTYRRRKALQSDLTRYYENCIVSASAKRFSGQRRKNYCAATAWKRVKATGRYPDYPGFTEERSTMAASRRGRSAKRRKRDRFGHFIKQTTRKAARKPASKKRRTSAAPKRKAARRTVKRSRTRAKRKTAKRTVRRAAPRRVKRKTSRRRAARRSTGMGMGESTMKRKHRRRSSKRRARESTAAAPRARKHRRRSHRRAAAYEVMPNPVKKSRRRRRRTGASRAIVPAVVRRKVGGHRRSMPGSIKIQIMGPMHGRRKTAGKRRSSKKGRKHTRRRSRKYSYPKGMRRHIKALHEPMLNPIGEYALENPLSGGELALAVGTAALGYFVADFLDRYMAVKGQANQVDANTAITAAPSLGRMGAQAALAALPFFGQRFVHQPMAKAALQGAGLGVGIHLVGQLFKSWVIGKFMATNATMQTYFPDTIGAQAIVEQRATANNPVPGTMAGGLGAPPSHQYPRTVYGLPAQRPNFNDPGPRAQTGVGVAPLTSYVPGTRAANPVNQGGGNNLPFPYVPPQGNGNGGPPLGGSNGCAPCSAQTPGAALQSSYSAAMAELGAPPVGRRMTSNDLFPTDD
jgi:hypothetical protein